MELRKTSGLLACATLLALALLSGCGGTSTSTTIPATTSFFHAHSLVFKNSSTVMGLGYNAFGQVGVNSLDNVSVATPVFNLPLMNRFAAGGDHSLAVSFSNLSTVYAWGSNYHGQIGTGADVVGNKAFSAVPLKLTVHPNGTSAGHITDISAGVFHSLVVMDGTIYSWGYNGYGQLGTRTGAASLNDSATPLQIQLNNAPLNNIVKVAGGGGHSLALAADGTVYAWGNNTYGQLGRNPVNVAFNQTPQFVEDGAGNPIGRLPSTIPRIVDIAASGSNSYAVDVNGHVWAWGYNGMGQIGRLTAADVANPVPQMITEDGTATGTPILAARPDVAGVPHTIAAGSDHVLVLEGDAAGNSLGTVWAWGFNEYGQLGTSASSTTNSFIPARVLKNGTVAGGPLTGVSVIYAYGTSSIARIGVRGPYLGWGDNGFGQLGNPVSATSLSKLFVPVPVQGL